MKRSNNRISTAVSESANATKSTPDIPAKNFFSRSPYAEYTRMIRVPLSLIPAIQVMLDKRKKTFAEGDPDVWN
jgi:hypothetical protein